MKKVLESTSDSFREKGSKFIGHLVPVLDKPAFEEKLMEIKAEYPDATHHCYALRLDPANLNEFSQDDGEPSGTAGLPILNHMKSYEVVDAAIIVVRYYGGTNLGKSGLIQAYGRAAENCLRKARLKTIKRIVKVEISFPYARQNEIDRLKHQFELEELDAAYQARVTMVLACPLKHQSKLTDALEGIKHLDIETTFLEEDYL